MASVAKDGKGWRILFVAPDGKRKTVRLGPVDRKGAESIRHHVEAPARIAGLPIPQATAIWLSSIGETLRARLISAGLIDAQHFPDITLKAFWMITLSGGRVSGHQPLVIGSKWRGAWLRFSARNGCWPASLREMRPTLRVG